MIYTKYKPLGVTHGIDIAEHDTDGRVITLEYKDYVIITCHSPSVPSKSEKLDYQLRWEKDLQAHVQTLDLVKPIILCGDMTIRDHDTGLKTIESTQADTWISDKELNQFTRFLEKGFIDAFHHFYSTDKEQYAWLEERFNVKGWHPSWGIDYFIVSGRLEDKLIKTAIHTDYTDCGPYPIELQLLLKSPL